jgi:hypothetical protein
MLLAQEPDFCDSADQTLSEQSENFNHSAIRPQKGTIIRLKPY